MIDFHSAWQQLACIGAGSWVGPLREYVDEHFTVRRYGDLPDWLDCLASLPDITVSDIDLVEGVRIGREEDASSSQRMQLERALRGLHPWRKGPFELFGIHVDAEWRSDWKWDRLMDHITPLAGRHVLDVGCGNGYHCWRMFGAGAETVTGIDPSPRFVVQFEAVRRYAGELPVYVLPASIETMPDGLGCFDTVFSMGVLYHRRSPIDHIRQLKSALCKGGELVLETLVVEGDDQTVLVPEDRYAMMRNVWFIPSVPLLQRWLRRCGLVDIRVVDISVTTTQEQRSTDWMSFQSLSDFLHPEYPEYTIEGLPAPKRAILIARNQA